MPKLNRQIKTTCHLQHHLLFANLGIIPILSLSISFLNRKTVKTFVTFEQPLPLGVKFMTILSCHLKHINSKALLAYFLTAVLGLSFVIK